MVDSYSYGFIVLVYIYVVNTFSFNVVSGCEVCERMLGEGEKKLRSNKWPITILELQNSMDRQEFI